MTRLVPDFYIVYDCASHCEDAAPIDSRYKENVRPAPSNSPVERGDFGNDIVIDCSLSFGFNSAFLSIVGSDCGSIEQRLVV